MTSLPRAIASTISCFATVWPFFSFKRHKDEQHMTIGTCRASCDHLVHGFEHLILAVVCAVDGPGVPRNLAQILLDLAQIFPSSGSLLGKPRDICPRSSGERRSPSSS